MKFDFQRRGLLCVVSGPAGSGKTTLCRAFSDADSSATYAVSATTRPPRTGEKDGKDYHFLTREAFQAKATRGEFLEFAEVHGRFYGTLKDEVIEHIRAGRDVLMDIDVQGAQFIRKSIDPLIQEALVDIFILPRSEEELVERLNNRGTEGQEELDLRLRNARKEMKHWAEYSYTVISGTKEVDFEIFSSIIAGERCRSHRLVPETDGSDEEQQEFGI
ncbi:guanylate kinase [bacterium]|jgi:guanylate kinase|nr:guanylate kinase [Verrucomicrobiales bacterium]MDC0311958.1 guanylate kinase [bacterium]